MLNKTIAILVLIISFFLSPLIGISLVGISAYFLGLPILVILWGIYFDIIFWPSQETFYILPYTIIAIIYFVLLEYIKKQLR